MIGGMWCFANMILFLCMHFWTIENNVKLFVFLFLMDGTIFNIVVFVIIRDILKEYKTRNDNISVWLSEF